MSRYCFTIRDLAGRTIASGIQVIVQSDGDGHPVLVDSQPSPQIIVPDRNGLIVFHSEAAQVRIKVQWTHHGESMARTIGRSIGELTFGPETELAQLVQGYGPVQDAEGVVPVTDLPRTANSSCMIEPTTLLDFRALNPGDVLRQCGEASTIAYSIPYAMWSLSMLVGEEVLWTYTYPLDDSGYIRQGVEVNPKISLMIDSIVVSRSGDTLEMLSSGNIYTEMYPVYGNATGSKKQHHDLISQTRTINRTQTQIGLQYAHTGFATSSPVFQWRWGIYTVKLLKP